MVLPAPGSRGGVTWEVEDGEVWHGTGREIPAERVRAQGRVEGRSLPAWGRTWLVDYSRYRICIIEETLSLAARPEPDSNEALWLKHVLWQEYEALAREGRLSLALHVVEGWPLHETAKLLNIPVIRLRRLLDREFGRLRKRLRRRGVGPSLR